MIIENEEKHKLETNQNLELFPETTNLNVPVLKIVVDKSHIFPQHEVLFF